MGLAEYRREKKAAAAAAAEAAAVAAALAASSPDAASAESAVEPANAAEPIDPADALTSEDAALLAGLRGELARYPGPGYRKAYLANLMESGKRYLIAGNRRAAAYCFDKISGAIAAALGTDEGRSGQGEEMDAAENSSSDDSVPEASPPSGNASGSETGDPVAAPGPRKPRAARAPAQPRPLTPTDLFRRDWREARLKDAEQVLHRHGGRLSALENKAYRERLDKLRHTAQTAATGPQSDRVDAGLLELRRRLYGRVLKSQKIALKRGRMPMTLARLALPPAVRGVPAAPTSPPATAVTRPPARTGKAPAVQVDTAWQPVVGPYNDRYNMEDLLSLIADADAAWVEEFLDLYRGLSGLQNLMVSISALKKT